jgi:protein TonB
VFENLIESNRKADKKRVAGIGLASLAVHSTLIGAAVYATLGATEANTNVVMDTTLVYLNQQQQQEEQPKPVQLDVQLKGFQTVFAPTDIPTDIPPINLQEKFDPRDYSGSGVEGGVGTGVSSGEVFAEALVEERPEVLSAPPLEYPPLLSQAGIEGTVVMQFVVDTMGRAEPGSIKVIRSTNPEFERPVRNVLARARFRPGRVHGRAVRVLVQQSYNFTQKK